MTLPIPQIKAAANIVTVISEYLPLKKSGNGLVGKCPFHQEKSGSFRVNPDTQRFRCFGCDAAGDVIQFVQDIERVTMAEAARRLAERFGVVIETQTEPVKPCHSCCGEGIICRESLLPWSKCGCGWCERGPITRIACPTCGGRQTEPVKPSIPAATARRIRSHAEQTSMECAWWVRRVTERLTARRDWVCGLACVADGEMGLDRRARVWRRIIERWESMTDGDRFRMYERRRARILRDYRDDVAWTELLVGELMNGRLKDIPGDDLFRYIGNGGR